MSKAPVTTPYIIDTDRVFSEENLVKLACDTEGAAIYYTLDGIAPDKKALLYVDPFVVNRTTTINMIAFKREDKSLVSQAVIKKAGEIKKVRMDEVEAGLTYKYTHGIYRMVHDFLNTAPIKTGIVPHFTIEAREKNQYFSFDYEGYIFIREAGEYTLYLATNDGGRLYIDDHMLINNDGLHPMVEVGKAISLETGLHPISVKYFQEGGRNGLLVSWEGPGFEKQEIPATVLFHLE